MSSSVSPSLPAPDRAPVQEREPPSPLEALLHRWLVEYNPLYLLSATLVLGGLWLLMRAAAASSTTLAFLGIGALAELYALCLIGAAAVLVRFGLRRPAAMLALVAALYQGDLTMHVETSAYLGAAGGLASLAWLALYAAKLRLLARALELRLSRSAFLVPLAGGAGLAAFPHLLRHVGPEVGGSLVVLWGFGVFAAGTWWSRGIDSAVPMDVRAERCVRATWALWSLLALAHVAYWVGQHRLHLGAALPALLLLAVHRTRSEAKVWALVGSAGLAALALAPGAFWVTGLMGAATLSLVALRTPPLRRLRVAAAASPASPYRTAGEPEAAPARLVPVAGAPARLLVGALVALYLALWSAGWTGGPLPDHVLLLDLALVGGCAGAARGLRRPLLAFPSAPVVLHLAVQLGWVAAPTGVLGWGVASTVAGFLGLAVSVVVSVRLRHRLAPDPQG